MHARQTLSAGARPRPADGSKEAPAPPFEPIVDLTVALTNVPFVFVQAKATGFAWMQHGKGLARSDYRSLSALLHTGLRTEDHVEVPDLKAHAEWRDSPFVRRRPDIRFIAAVTVHDQQSGARAVVAVLDTRPRTLTRKKWAALRHLAHLALREASAHRKTAELAQAHAETTHLRQAVDHVEHRHRSLLSDVQEILWETDPAGKVTWISSGRTAFPLAPPEAMAGQPFAECVHPDDQPAFGAFLQEAASRNGRHMPRLLVRYRSVDGGYSWGELRVRALIDPDGIVSGIRGSLIDVSDRKQIEAALSLSESRFQAIFERAALGILLLLPDGRTLTANPASLRMLGRSELELRTHPLVDLLQGEERDRWQRAFDGLLSGQQDAIRLACQFLRKRAGLVEADVQANVVRDEDGHPLFAVVLLKDVTDDKRAQQELVRAKRRAEEVAAFKSTLLNNVSHELRTPLATILGFTSILAGEVADEQREFIRMIRYAAERLTDTLNGVVDLALLESGDLVARPELLNVMDEVQDVVIKMMPSAYDKAIDLTAEGPEAPVFATGDRSFLHRILKNLIGNAIKFTDSGSAQVRVEADDREIRIHVRDSGPGIGEGFLPSLFEPFRQESSGMARTHEGAGLGLSVTKRLVERMGGRISVESRKDVGSTFTVSLPRAACTEG